LIVAELRILYKRMDAVQLPSVDARLKTQLRQPGPSIIRYRFSCSLLLGEKGWAHRQN